MPLFRTKAIDWPHVESDRKAWEEWRLLAKGEEPMTIAISSGHSLLVRGASGYLDEVNEARRTVERIADLLRNSDIEVFTFHDEVSDSQSDNLEAIVDFHNSCDRILDISIHFNAYVETEKPMGCEVLYLTQDRLAAEISAVIAHFGKFINRGAKYRDDLYFLNNTTEPAILLEICFVDSKADADLYQQYFDDICKGIATFLVDEWENQTS
jgi:N-acetylmuramoyl-L-alanine amidase